jgi:hypothetical protein
VLPAWDRRQPLLTLLASFRVLRNHVGEVYLSASPALPASEALGMLTETLCDELISPRFIRLITTSAASCCLPERHPNRDDLLVPGKTTVEAR